MIDIAIFDVAGTVIEEHGAVYGALADAARAFGATPSEDDVEQWMGADKRTAITALLDGRGDADAAFQDFRTRLDATYRARPPQPMPGAEELFDALRRQGIRIALTTGFDRDVTASVLDAAGWKLDSFDAVICTEDVEVGRPAPYMVFRALERTGCTDVRRALVAGDTPRDVGAGLNAGAGLVVGVRSGGLGDDVLAVDPRVVVLDTVAGIAGLLAPSQGER